MFKVVRIEIFCADPDVFIVAILVRFLSPSQSTSGGGGYLSTVCGTGTCHFLGVLFSNHYGIMGIIFTVF